MKVNIYKILFALGLLVFTLSAAAQNLDPTVEVNRAYEGKLLEVNKPVMTMAVPDSVKQFDLDFDYSVFENPYKGSYDFKPYQLLMKPMSSERDFNNFWLKAGAGYTLYPELSMVWTPAFKGQFKMNVYADYDGYFGSYRSFKPSLADDGELYLKRWERVDRQTSHWNGYRMQSKAGIDGRVDWKKGHVNFDVAYVGIASKDTLKNHSYNGVDARINVASRPVGDDYFMYDISAAYRFGQDNIRYKADDKYVTENVFSFDARLGKVIASTHNILIDAGFDFMSYAGNLSANVSELSITPHYLFTKDRWRLDAGLKIAKIIRPEESLHYNAKDQFVYPDISVRYAVLKDAMSLYGKIAGGNHIHTYSSLLERNPFLHLTYGQKTQIFDSTIERISFVIGVDGRISRRFTYDFKAGFASYANGLLERISLYGAADKGYHYGLTYDYASYNKLFVGLDWNWHAESISFNGSVEYAHYAGKQLNGLFLPAAFTGDVAFEYNWNRRLFLGVDCRFSTAKRGTIVKDETYDIVAYEPVPAVVPGFADLGVYAEYSLNRKLSFWLRGGNLMNATIQYTPLYAEKGINFTAGICLKL